MADVPTPRVDTHCRHGHEWTPENTYQAPGRSYRQCRICLADAHRRWVEAHRRKKRTQPEVPLDLDAGPEHPDPTFIWVARRWIEIKTELIPSYGAVLHIIDGERNYGMVLRRKIDMTDLTQERRWWGLADDRSVGPYDRPMDAVAALLKEAE